MIFIKENIKYLKSKYLYITHIILYIIYYYKLFTNIYINLHLSLYPYILLTPFIIFYIIIII